MAIFDKLMNAIGLEEEDDENEEGTENKNSLVPEQKPFEMKTPAPVSAMSAPRTATAPRSEVPKATINSRTGQFQMVVIEPSSFDDSPKLVDKLKAKKPVVINLENLETDVARKIFDFLSGATYALNGNIQKVSNNIFVFAPDNVDISFDEGRKTGQTSSESLKSPWSR